MTVAVVNVAVVNVGAASAVAVNVVVVTVTVANVATVMANSLPPRDLADDALAMLQAYIWPGNVRQLRNMMEWLAIMAPGEPGGAVAAGHLPADILYSNPLLAKPEVNADIMSLALRESKSAFP